jgi:hypothetical protein
VGLAQLAPAPVAGQVPTSPVCVTNGDALDTGSRRLELPTKVRRAAVDLSPTRRRGAKIQGNYRCQGLRAA